MTAGIRVLVVDDDFRVAGLHRDIVASRPGFTALEPVGSLSRARAAIRAGDPDLLLVDAYLPDGDGVGLIRESERDAVMLSAAGDSPTIRRALRAGAFGYLIKPFEARALGDLLDRYARFRNLLDGRPRAQPGRRRPSTVDPARRRGAVALAVGDRAAHPRVARRRGRIRERRRRPRRGLTGDRPAPPRGARGARDHRGEAALRQHRAPRAPVPAEVSRPRRSGQRAAGATSARKPSIAALNAFGCSMFAA